MTLFGFEYPEKDIVFNLLIISATAIVTGVLTYGATWLFDLYTRNRRFNEAISLLIDEISNLNTDPHVFDPNPRKIHQLNPISIFGLRLLLEEHFERLSKNPLLLHAISDLNVSIMNLNSFMDSYHQVVWNNLGDINVKKKMFINAEAMRANVGIDQQKLIQILKK